MREEYMNTKLKNTHEVSNLKDHLKGINLELEDLKHNHFVLAQERIDNLVKEKADLRSNLEESIVKLRSAHDQDVSEKAYLIKNQKEHVHKHLEAIRIHKMEAEYKLSEQLRELNSMQDALRSGKRLNDLQIEDNNRLKKELNDLKKENEIHCKEYAL